VAYLHDFFCLLKTLSGRKLLNFLILKSSYFYSCISGRMVHSGKPAYISVEPTTSCNLHCPECFISQPGFDRPHGLLTKDNFKRIISQFSESAFYLNLYFQGEPFMNPELIDMIALAKDQGFYVVVSTNGHFLDELTVRKLISSRLDRLIVSLDGVDAATYNAYRKNGNFDKVVSGIENIISEKKSQKVRAPFIELQFVHTRKNQHQLFEIKKFGKKTGVDKVSIKSFQLLNFNHVNEWLPDENTRYKIGTDGKVKINSKLPDRCFRLWSSCVITWDGNVVPCCFDKNADYSMGNIYRQQMSQIWKSRAYNNFREKVFTDRKNIDICCNCSEGLLK